MIKFEEHEGKLFRMLEEPVPLKEKNTDVLVQFITHGVIGEYVMEHWLDCGQENAPIFVDSVDSDGDVTVFIENGNEHYGCPFPMFEIIGIFVVEGSDEWALWAMMDGKKVWSFDVIDIIGEGYVAMGKRESSEVIAFHFVNTDTNYECNSFMSIDEFLSKHRSSGWQIYEPEPEPELPREPEYVICKRCGGSKSIPNPAVSNTAYTTCPKCGGTGYEIKEQKPDNLYLNIKPSNPADWCFDKKNLLVLVDDNFKGIVGENVTQEQVGEIAKLLTEPSGWQLYEPEPEQPKYKVGDWVEIECQNKLYHKQVLFVTENRVGFEFSGTTPSVCFDGTPSHIFKFIRKLSPSEVIVHIGCMSGTVRCCDNEFICPESTPDNPCHFVLQDQITGFWSIIYFKMLDARTRELVESLLEAMQEEEK